MEETTIHQLQSQQGSQSLSAAEITRAYLERIERLDRAGPALNSVIEINPDALAIAAGLDEERRAGRLRGPLHGIPVLIKDIIETADRMQTTAGSLALEGSYAAADAFIVTRLREAGAVILGKTNLSEWSNFRSPHSSSGWSSRGGQTRNPYALDRNPCGSSSGSGVAAAANLAAVAVGCETDGSIICPSHANGIVGLKPTLGLISRRGIIPIAHSQDSAGPMARTVTDAAILLAALTGVDPDDPASGASAGQSHADYTRFLDPGGLRGARIGVARDYFGFDPQVDRIMEASLAAMKDAGALLIDPVELKTRDQLAEYEIEVLYYEFKANLETYLSGLSPQASVHSMAEVIAFNERHHQRVMPYFGQERFSTSLEKGPLTDEKYLQAREHCLRLARREGIDAVLSKHRLQAIVAPSGGPAWLTDWVNGDHYSGGSSSMAAVAGYPNITVPAGQIFGLPVGISFFAGAWQEPLLLKLAFAFEQVTRIRRPPTFAASVDPNPA